MTITDTIYNSFLWYISFRNDIESSTLAIRKEGQQFQFHVVIDKCNLV